MRYGLFMGLSGALALGACGEKGSQVEVGGVAAVDFALVMEPNFNNNSVKICADRGKDADGKYPCRSHKCECFNFDANGLPVDKWGKTARFDDLCPSIDYPSKGADGDWTFTYKVYAEKECPEPPLYPDMFVITSPSAPDVHNFACYDENNLAAKKDPNKSVERLEPGENCNELVCLTKNASKFWEFDVCVQLPTVPADGCTEDATSGLMCPTPPPPSKLRLDCGCVRKVYRLDGSLDEALTLAAAGPVDAAHYVRCECDQLDEMSLPPSCYLNVNDYCTLDCIPSPK